MAATYSSLVGIAVGGKYEIRRVIGVGGMGVVCEAVHKDIGKKVAIKLIDKSMKESDLIVARFRREARAAGQIQSEHIVTVFDVGADPRVGLYIVMEQLVGEDLQTRLEREKRLDVRTAIMIAHQVARGLQRAHAVGVVHRDLKPGNVFLTERDNGQLLVKLLDFGVSKLLDDEAGGGRITGSGAPIGTPLYMSPEQAEGREDTDGRADIWSLGAMLYEALAGTPPFPDRGSYHGTIVGILTSRPKLLHDAAPWVPPAVAKVVDAMLVHDRDARLKDASVVAKRLVEAFPAVLPDGTGRHTAIVVADQGTIDVTGDTEFFTSASVPPSAQRARGSRPTPPPSSAEGSSKTVPNVTTAPGAEELEVSPSARRTAAATPIVSERPSSPESRPPELSDGAPPHPARGPDAPSSASVATGYTPQTIDPLPPSQIAPDTVRDDELAARAERRRSLSLAALGVAIAAIAVGSYAAGRSARDKATASVSPASAAAPAWAPGSGSGSASASASAPASAAASAAASALRGDKSSANDAAVASPF